MSKGHCAVFLDKMTLMVIGGHEGGTKYTKTTFILDITANVWSPGPPMSMNRVAIQLGTFWARILLLFGIWLLSTWRFYITVRKTLSIIFFNCHPGLITPATSSWIVMVNSRWWWSEESHRIFLATQTLQKSTISNQESGDLVKIWHCWTLNDVWFGVISGNEYPFEVYEHGSAYYKNSFVVLGGYGEVDGALDSIYL